MARPIPLHVLVAGLALTAFAVAPAQSFAALAAQVATSGSSSSAAKPTDSGTNVPPRSPAVQLPQTVPGDYRLGAGDKLRIEVYKDPQLSQSLQVRPDGKITMPLIGDIVAVDRTPLELRDEIANSLKEYITNPVVTVIVTDALASNIYVMGEVNKAGPLPLQGPMTALQALAMAGGFKDFANTKDIKILRRGPKGVETIKFNYREALKGNGTPVYLRAGDTIIVP